MAPKRPSPLDNPLSSEDEQSDEISDSQEFQNPEVSSSSESEEEDERESDVSAAVSDLTVKPESPKPKNPKSASKQVAIAAADVADAHKKKGKPNGDQKKSPKALETDAKSAKTKAKGVEGLVEKESNKKAKKDKPLDLVKGNGNEIVVEKGVVCEGLEVDQVGFWDKYPRLKEALEMENNDAFIDLSKMGDAKAKELDDQWKRYQAKEAELKLFKLELVVEQTKAVAGQLMKL